MKRIRKVKAKELIEILWIDSVHNTDGWVKRNKFDFDGHYKSMTQLTTGYFVKETKEALSVAQSLATDNSDWISNIWTIPKGCIKSIKKLKRK